MGEPLHAAVIGERLGGDVAPVASGALLAQRLHDNGETHAKRLRAGMDAPVLEIPLQVEPRAGLAMTRAVAAALAQSAQAATSK
jgi:hypothetical protein